MAYVVTENCTDCRFTDCVEVCPVAAFHGEDDRVYIDPTVCIDCGACLPLCPVKAIYEDYDLTGDQEKWIELKAERAPALPVIRKKQPLLETAEGRRAALGYN